MAFDTTATLVTVPPNLGYRSGTFTPTLAFGGTEISTLGGTYSTQTGHYTIVGDRLFFNARVTLSAKGSATGDITFRTNLASPLLAAENTAVAVQLGVITSGVGAGFVSADALGSTSSVRISEVSAGTRVPLTDAALTSTSVIDVAGHWRIA